MNQREWGKCRNCGATYKRRREERMALCVPCARQRLRDPEFFDRALARKEKVKAGLQKIAGMAERWR